MLHSDVGRGEEAEEGRSLCRGLDRGTAVRFFAFDDAHDSGDDHAGFARGLEGGDGGGAGGADVVDDDDAGAFAAKAFDAAAGAVSLFSLANEEAVEQRVIRDAVARARRWPWRRWRRWGRRPW